MLIDDVDDADGDIERGHKANDSFEIDSLHDDSDNDVSEVSYCLRFQFPVRNLCIVVRML